MYDKLCSVMIPRNTFVTLSMFSFIATIYSVLLAWPVALVGQKTSAASVPNTAKGFDEQFKAIYSAFEKGDERDLNARISTFAVPSAWFVDMFGSEQGAALAKQYSEQFHNFGTALIGEFQAGSQPYWTKVSGQVSTKTSNRPIPADSRLIATANAIAPLPPVQQFEIRYQTSPVHEKPDLYQPSHIDPPVREVIAPGRDDSWVDSFVYVDGAFRYFGGNGYVFWDLCSMTGPLPAGRLVRYVLPKFPENVRYWEVYPFFVQMRITVAKNGDVKKIEILQGDAHLVEAAREAVQQWRYEPFLKCGEPIEKQLTMTVGLR